VSPLALYPSTLSPNWIAPNRSLSLRSRTGTHAIVSEEIIRACQNTASRHLARNLASARPDPREKCTAISRTPDDRAQYFFEIE